MSLPKETLSPEDFLPPLGLADLYRSNVLEGAVEAEFTSRSQLIPYKCNLAEVLTSYTNSSSSMV